MNLKPIRLFVMIFAAALGGLIAGNALWSHFAPAPSAPQALQLGAWQPVATRGAPIEIAYQDGAGAARTLAGLRGKVVLVNLWATWCAPCIKELPSLAKLQQALGGDQFQVVTIALDERDPTKIEPFLASHGAANLPALIDRGRTVDTVAEVSALPTSLLVDRDGKVKAMLTGDACWNQGNALAAVQAFIADGTVMTDALESCE